jgi:hypothetical protein
VLVPLIPGAAVNHRAQARLHEVGPPFLRLTTAGRFPVFSLALAIHTRSAVGCSAHGGDHDRDQPSLLRGQPRHPGPLHPGRVGRSDLPAPRLSRVRPGWLGRRRCCGPLLEVRRSPKLICSTCRPELRRCRIQPVLLASSGPTAHRPQPGQPVTPLSWSPPALLTGRPPGLSFRARLGHESVGTADTLEPFLRSAHK